MKKHLSGSLKTILLAGMFLTTFSCKNTFDIAPENVLEYDNMYRNVYDADAAIFGIYGKLTGVMDRYIVLNELRADLADVTPNADKYLRQLNEHAVETDNPWADPRPYYNIIANCNDVIKNFKIMLADKRMSTAEYNIRYAEVVTVWSWVYLQIGIHYGNVPYLSEPIENLDDLKDTAKYPRISFTDLLSNLDKVIQTVDPSVITPIQLTTSQINLPLIAAGSSLIRVVDGYNTQRMFLFRPCVFGDVYLWKGDYAMAAHYYKMVLEYGDIVDPARSGTVHTYYKASGINGAQNANWDLQFTTAFDADDKTEIMNNLPFDRNFSPKNPFIDLFLNSGKYLIKPSNLAVKNWNEQLRNDGSVIDISRGEGNSYTGGSMPEIRKFKGLYNPVDPFGTNGKIILYRAGGVQLHFAEAANRDGRDRLAYALLNVGIGPAYRGAPPVPSNVTNIQQSFDSNPDYYFDGRQGTYPQIRGTWYQNAGIRGRVSLQPAKVDSALYFNMSEPGKWIKDVTDRPGLTRAMEELLVNEGALEMAYEGVRWSDLVRVARRREAELGPGQGSEYLYNKIAAKFIAANKPIPAGVENLKKSMDNWFLPFKWQ